jgi:hypothetical protein
VKICIHAQIVSNQGAVCINRGNFRDNIGHNLLLRFTEASDVTGEKCLYSALELITIAILKAFSVVIENITTN